MFKKLNFTKYGEIWLQLAVRKVFAKHGLFLKAGTLIWDFTVFRSENFICKTLKENISECN
jgi:hypothetical protein